MTRPHDPRWREYWLDQDERAELDAMVARHRERRAWLNLAMGAALLIGVALLAFALTRPSVAARVDMAEEQPVSP